jgi:trans-2,3-dihydro-3-hydroxyanthranilate isomerase
MAGVPFFIVDVFAERKYAGNQLAVFAQAGHISAAQMQKMAKEMNYSETTFILSSEPRNGGYDARIFTPDREIPFAGHPTLGTAFIVQQEIIGQPVEKVILNLKVGQIPVAFSYTQGEPDQLQMKQKEPAFGSKLGADSIAEVLGLEEKELDDHFPVEEVSTGLPFVIVPLKTLDSLKRIQIDRNRCYRLTETLNAKAFLAFCPQTHHEHNDLCVRVFADYYGVPEDPATGSANGCLAGYLVKHGYFGKNSIDIRIEQGYEIGRPSLLLLKAQERQKAIEVFVAGKVIKIARGEFV